MRNDQIFVLMLVILLPMSGCFNGAVGEAEAEEDSEEGNDVEHMPQMFSISGVIDENTSGEDRYNYGYNHVWLMYNFSTSAGEAVKLHLLEENQHTAVLRSNCEQGITWGTGVGVNLQYSWVPSSDLDCTHTFEIWTSGNFDASSDHVYYSALFSIHNVTDLT